MLRFSSFLLTSVAYFWGSLQYSQQTVPIQEFSGKQNKTESSQIKEALQ